MGDVQSLAGRDAVEKITHIAKGEIAMLCTFTNDAKMHTRPMGTSAIDPDGSFWFMSHRGSGKNREIAANASVQVVYSDSGKSEFLTVEGRATISRDQKKIDELWNGFMKTWFNQGKEDPNITLIHVQPTGGYYWDTKHNKMVQLASIAIGALTGKELDDGIEGKLRT